MRRSEWRTAVPVDWVKLVRNSAIQFAIPLWSSGLSRICLLGAAGLVLWWPTQQRLAEGIWRQPAYAYTAWLTAVAWLLFVWRIRTVRLEVKNKPSFLAWMVIGAGTVLYLLGRTQGLEQLELGACLILLFGLLLLAGGWPAVNCMRFPLVFWLFTLPYPAWVIDQLTGPLKLGLSEAVEVLLYAAGYPVARSGVIIALGQYRLLVEDACSGLHSLLFLVAMGLIYLHFTGPRREWHRWILVAALVPLGLFANLIRVLVLALSTYHFGDGVAQGLWHSAAGVMLYGSGFIALYLLDGGLARVCPLQQPTLAHVTQAPGADKQKGVFHSLSWRQTVVLALLWLITGLAAVALTPRAMLSELRPMPDLHLLLPSQVGEWHKEDISDNRYVSVEATRESNGAYDQLLQRTYVDPAGHRIMLVMAYGSRQLGSAYQVHRPEACYQASGFLLLQSSDAVIAVQGEPLAVRQFYAQQNSRQEAVTYWMTIGQHATMPGLARKFEQLKSGLSGQVPDGMLVRISSLEQESEAGFRRHRAFVNDLQRVLPGWFGLPGNSASMVPPRNALLPDYSG
jgi:EpsI family protein